MASAPAPTPDGAPEGARPDADEGVHGPLGSFGNISDRHWTRARRDANPEALEYYRSRNRSPGVAEGGSARNTWCMECDGVIPFGDEVCPHCGASLVGMARRYFNWVEIDKPPDSDLRALLPVLLAVGALAVAVLGGLAWWVFG